MAPRRAQGELSSDEGRAAEVTPSGRETVAPSGRRAVTRQSPVPSSASAAVSPSVYTSTPPRCPGAPGQRTPTRSLSVQLSGLDDLTRLAQKRARTALVSGGLEPVEDAGGGGHSVFARAFLDSLLANTGAVETSQIFSSMRRQVLTRAAQTPQYGDIRQTGHEGGDFIFVRRN